MAKKPDIRTVIATVRVELAKECVQNMHSYDLSKRAARLHAAAGMILADVGDAPTVRKGDPPM